MTWGEISEPVRIRVEGALGRVHLNRPEVLNSLDLAMVRLIEAGLDRLEADPAVQTIALTGEGERALCAGGDIKTLWSTGRIDPQQALTFWAEEYRLDARIAHLSKPWVAVMDGICMGGGVGLSIHGSHRIVTERTKFALPETGIGLFPDVGATWALPRAPAGLGSWIGLAGAVIGAADTIVAGLADAMVPSAAVPALLADLAAGRDAEAAVAAHAEDPGPSRLLAEQPLLQAAFQGRDILETLEILQQDGSAFALETLDHLRKKSPASLILTQHLLQEGGVSPDLESCLDREFAAVSLLLTGADFYEGVRAAVIDKDRAPKWSPPILEAVDRVALLAGLRPHPSLFPA